MKIGVTAPYKQPEISELGDYIFLLPHHLTSEQASYYKVRHEYKVLDNGAAENSMITPSDMLCLAETFGVDEIVAPDYLFDTDKTIDAFCEVVDQQPDCRVMGVPQGDTIEEWLGCLHELMYHGAYTIGVSKITVPFLVNNDTMRSGLKGHDFFEEINKYPIMDRRHIWSHIPAEDLHHCKFHVLGLRDFNEVVYFPRSVVRLDTTYFLTLAKSKTSDWSLPSSNTILEGRFTANEITRIADYVLYLRSTLRHYGVKT